MGDLMVRNLESSALGAGAAATGAGATGMGAAATGAATATGAGAVVTTGINGVAFYTLTLNSPVSILTSSKLE